jgi:hypothetical protein
VSRNITRPHYNERPSRPALTRRQAAVTGNRISGQFDIKEVELAFGIANPQPEIKIFNASH